MRSPAECFAKAVEMSDLAETASGKVRRNYFDMAKSWRILGAQAELQDRWADVGEPAFSSAS
jgi:hypothetical protein